MWSLTCFRVIRFRSGPYTPFGKGDSGQNRSFPNTTHWITSTLYVTKVTSCVQARISPMQVSKYVRMSFSYLQHVTLLNVLTLKTNCNVFQTNVPPHYSSLLVNLLHLSLVSCRFVSELPAIIQIFQILSGTLQMFRCAVSPQ